MKHSQLCKASNAETFPRGGSKDLFPSSSFRSFTSWYPLVCQIFLGIFQITVYSSCSCCASAKLLRPSLFTLPLLESKIKWCATTAMCYTYVLSICLFYESEYIYAQNRYVYTHTYMSMVCRDQRYTRHRGKTWKVPRYLKTQQSTDVQLIPNTFKKLAPQPLPACSAQATSQCLLLYISLELQYYWEAAGRLVLPYASRAYSGKVFTAQTIPFQTVNISKLSTLSSLIQHYQEILLPILKSQLYTLTVSNHLFTRFLLP